MFSSDDQTPVAVFDPTNDLVRFLNKVIENVNIKQQRKRHAYIQSQRRKLIRKEVRRRKLFPRWIRKHKPFPTFVQCEIYLQDRYNKEMKKDVWFDIDLQLGMKPICGDHSKTMASNLLKSIEDGRIAGTPTAEKVVIPTSDWNSLLKWKDQYE